MLVLLTVAIPSVSVAHDIASDVTIQAFVKPEGQRLYFLVRVPLEAMQDYEFPQFDRGYIDIEAADSMLRDAAIWWIANAVDLYEDGARLAEGEIAAVHISLPSDRSFRSYEEAFANVTGPSLPGRPQLPWEQALLDVLFEYQIENDTARYSIDPKFARLGIRTTTVVRFNAPGKPERAFQFSGDPGLVNLDPSFFQAVFRFVELGFFHILDGLDHLLFLLCLVIPIRAFRRLVPVVTSFTVAHSITLIASASGLAPNSLWFPPLVEMLIALSIVYMALENIVGANIGRRWLIAFAFGLVHGFGFSFVLRETLQFAGSHLITSLLAFNVGVEIGQLFVLALVVPVLAWGFRRCCRANGNNPFIRLGGTQCLALDERALGTIARVHILLAGAGHGVVRGHDALCYASDVSCGYGLATIPTVRADREAWSHGLRAETGGGVKPGFMRCEGTGVAPGQVSQKCDSL